MTFAPAKLIAFGVVIIVTGCIYYLLYMTNTGKSIRASAQNETGAKLMGINVRNIRAIAFGIERFVRDRRRTAYSHYEHLPYPWRDLPVKVLCDYCSRWYGKSLGALVSGLIIGVVESLSGYYLGGSWSEMVIYGIFI